jgi:hypothetical protein
MSRIIGTIDARPPIQDDISHCGSGGGTPPKLAGEDACDTRGCATVSGVVYSEPTRSRLHNANRKSPRDGPPCRCRVWRSAGCRERCSNSRRATRDCDFQSLRPWGQRRLRWSTPHQHRCTIPKRCHACRRVPRRWASSRPPDGFGCRNCSNTRHTHPSWHRRRQSSRRRCGRGGRHTPTAPRWADQTTGRKPSPAISPGNSGSRSN